LILSLRGAFFAPNFVKLPVYPCFGGDFFGHCKGSKDMARPHKITEKQWTEIEKRIPPAGGESVRSVAKEYGVSEGVIRKRVKTHTKPINELANQIARTELEFERLPINTQVKVRTLADRLKGISEHLAGAAEMGAMTSHRLATIANTEVQKIDESDIAASEQQIKTVAALTELANRASVIGVGLLAANKEQMKDLPKDSNLRTLTDAELAEIASGA
jgi:hypothetical protein